ncbi:S-formylglutathione hydrolase [Altericista sp. CCNU0014]|uniref:S-formylglutathione hydrolase n=1 Tax=Altericista sp. CCNU0014 TaxID=3082949 RepID=UPI00384B169D
MTVQLKILKQHAIFDGTLSFCSHFSAVCHCPMNFSIYVPQQASQTPLPVLYFLAGLTCTEENFMAKAGAQRYAAELGLILVAPDTSPRNTGIPGEGADWDFGAGAGFYVDATESPWNKHYRTYSYVVEELPTLISEYFPADVARQGIFGHSMGGHGALVCGLRNGDRYRSISAFAPIAAPSQCPWGQKALMGYLGADRTAWDLYDATAIVSTLPADSRPILIDQGMSDPFLSEQLRPELFVKACRATKRDLTYREHSHYDHSYYFIATFIEDHIQFHARHLNP